LQWTLYFIPLPVENLFNFRPVFNQHKTTTSKASSSNTEKNDCIKRIQNPKPQTPNPKLFLIFIACYQ